MFGTTKDYLIKELRKLCMSSFIICSFSCYYRGRELQEDEMGSSRRRHGEKEKGLEVLNWKSQRKASIRDLSMHGRLILQCILDK
jgi:hypothetical protein